MVYLLFDVRLAIRKRIRLFSAMSLIYSRRNVTLQPSKLLYTKGGLKGASIPKLKKEGLKKASWF